MPVIATQKVTSGSAVSQDTYTIASANYDKNTVIVAAVASDNGGTAINNCTLTGAGLTWTQQATVTDGGGTRRMTLFRALASNPASGTLTIDWGGQNVGGCEWSVTQLYNVDLGGTNGANAIVQAPTGTGTGTQLSISLAAFGSADNGTYGSCFINRDENITPGPGEGVELGQDATSGDTIETYRLNSENNPMVWDWSSSSVYVGIAAETKFQLAPPDLEGDYAYFL